MVCVCMCVYIYICIYMCVCVCAHTHIHTMEYYSAIKKNEIMPVSATCMDIRIIKLRELSVTETKIIRYGLYVESKKVIQMNLHTKQKQTHRRRK